jgi:transcriptional regulator with XRE-family HTH domain
VDVTGGERRALRKARRLTVRDLARAFRKASPQRLPQSLDQMIRSWERGAHRPSETYEHLYAAVFPELAALDSTALPGELATLAADLGRRVEAMPDPAQVTALEAAALARVPADRADEIRAMARAALENLEQFHDRLRQIAEALEGEAGR